MNSMEERKIYYDNFKHEYTLTPDPLFEDVHRYASVYPGLKEDHYSEYYIGSPLDPPYVDINMYFTYTNEDVANDEVGTKRGFCLKIFSTYYLASITLPPKEYTKTLTALLEENHVPVATTNTNISLVDEDKTAKKVDTELYDKINANKDLKAEGRNELLNALKELFSTGETSYHRSYDYDEMNRIFGTASMYEIISKFTAEEIISKTQELSDIVYKKNHAFKIGDIIKSLNHGYGMVLAVIDDCGDDNPRCVIMYEDEAIEEKYANEIFKTGLDTSLKDYILNSIEDRKNEE